MTILDSPLESPATLRLSTAMREGSMAEHEAAENAPFMGELLGGTLVRPAYADYLLRFRVVYAALEQAVRTHAGDPMLAPLHDTALERLGAIDADLAFWAPGVDPAAPVDSPAASAYRDRIAAAAAEAARGWGGALVAHHYTRYLGDLSGGQAIGRILERTFDLDGRGIAFYDFAEIPKPKPYKDRYRAALDSLEVDDADIARVVEEVRAVFTLNHAIFVELGRDLDAYRA